MTELGGNDGSGALGLNLNFDVDGKGMTIGRVMDWVEGRLDMITGEDEEEQGGNAGGGTQDDEDQKPAKPKAATETAKRMQPTRSKQPQSGVVAQDGVVQVPPAPSSTTSAQATVAAPFGRSSPPAPPPADAYRQPTTIPPSSSPASVRTSYPLSQGALTRSRSRASVSEKQTRRLVTSQQQEPLTSDFTFAMPLPHNASPASGPAFHSDFNLGTANSDVTSAPPSAQSVLGTKRRHASMVSEIHNTQAGPNSATSASPTSPGGRRRRGPSNASSGGASRSMVMNGDAMDVEDEPARKRVARR